MGAKRIIRSAVLGRGFAWLFVFGLIPDLTLCQGQDGFVLPQTKLEALDPSRPEDYRNLAEEVSEFQGNKSAKDLTIRLYLVCAAHSSGKLRRSALRGLLDSARDKDEVQKFKVLAYMLDDQFSDLLYRLESESTDSANVNPTKESKEAKEKLLDALRSLRQGKTRRASKIMENEAVQKAYRQAQPTVSLSDFLKACDSGKVSNDLLLGILQLDAQLRQSSVRVKENNPGDGSIEDWRKLFKNRLPPRVSNVKLSSATEFDPQKSVYRNGVWRNPAK